MIVQDCRSSATQNLDLVGAIALEVCKYIGIFLKYFCMGWATCAILFFKPKHWDPLAKATIFFVGRNYLLGKRKTVKRKRYLK